MFLKYIKMKKLGLEAYNPHQKSQKNPKFGMVFILPEAFT